MAADEDAAAGGPATEAPSGGSTHDAPGAAPRAPGPRNALFPRPGEAEAAGEGAAAEAPPATAAPGAQTAAPEPAGGPRMARDVPAIAGSRRVPEGPAGGGGHRSFARAAKLKDATDALSVSEGAGRSAIEAAFRRAAKSCHPDKAAPTLTAGEVAERQQQFKRLCDAKSLLLSFAGSRVRPDAPPIEGEGAAAQALARAKGRGKGQRKGKTTAGHAFLPSALDSAVSDRVLGARSDRSAFHQGLPDASGDASAGPIALGRGLGGPSSLVQTGAVAATAADLARVEEAGRLELQALREARAGVSARAPRPEVRSAAARAEARRELAEAAADRTYVSRLRESAARESRGEKRAPPVQLARDRRHLQRAVLHNAEVLYPAALARRAGAAGDDAPASSAGRSLAQLEAEYRANPRFRAHPSDDPASAMTRKDRRAVHKRQGPRDEAVEDRPNLGGHAPGSANRSGAFSKRRAALKRQASRAALPAPEGGGRAAAWSPRSADRQPPGVSSRRRPRVQGPWCRSGAQA